MCDHISDALPTSRGGVGVDQKGSFPKRDQAPGSTAKNPFHKRVHRTSQEAFLAEVNAVRIGK
jgi:hypothetical protein